jgi:hypothetical protein
MGLLLLNSVQDCDDVWQKSNKRRKSNPFLDRLKVGSILLDNRD